MLKNDLYQCHGRPFGFEHLKFLSKNFSQSFEDATEKFAHLPFLKVYQKDSSFIKKTFWQFRQEAEAVKNYLLRDFSDCDTVVLVDENSYPFTLLTIAALWAGFKICPLNPNDTSTRLQQKIEQLEVNSAIFVGDSFFNHLSLQQSFCLGHKWLEKILALPIKSMPIKPRSLFAPMIFIFTSGSTGYSKIVEQTEAGILANIDALVERHDFSKRQKILATPLPLFHVNALEFSFFSGLLSGQNLILFSNFDFFQILKSMAEDRIEILSLVPSLLKIFVDHARKLKSSQHCLDYIITAAASLPPQLAKTAALIFPFKIIQGYGLSEAVNFSCLMPPDLPKSEIDYWLTNFARPSIGTELLHNQVFIIDEKGQTCKEGETGEVCIRGYNVMLGYRGKDLEADNAVVFTDQFLHTGDLGFYQYDAKSKNKFYFISGRKKDVIKRTGNTISLLEIDDFLTAFPEVNLQGIAVPFDHEHYGEDVGIMINGSNISEKVVDNLKQHLMNLPFYVRPHVIMQTNEDLRTASGKPQRWKFTPLFKPYASMLFGENQILIKLP